jgi:hypothetical protein
MFPDEIILSNYCYILTLADYTLVGNNSSTRFLSQRMVNSQIHAQFLKVATGT